MHGDDGDHGTWTFHATEFVGPTSIGGLASVDTPELFDPRNPGQAGVAPSVNQHPAANIKQNNVSFFIVVVNWPKR
jgi:hypothetical protein